MIFACSITLPLIILQETLIDPCIKGTLNVLKSCSKASSVKRVVLTSSCSSIRYREDAQQVSPLNESHWSDPEYCKQNNVITVFCLIKFFQTSYKIKHPYMCCILMFLSINFVCIAALVCICEDNWRESGMGSSKTKRD